jgi:hypothetical protein
VYFECIVVGLSATVIYSEENYIFSLVFHHVREPKLKLQRVPMFDVVDSRDTNLVICTLIFCNLAAA